jgi:hypothetical protein
MYDLDPIKWAVQYNFLFFNYHGLAPGSVSAVHPILADKGIMLTSGKTKLHQWNFQ